MNRWAPFDKQNIENPHNMYKVLRRESPFFKAHTGEWIVTRYDDIKSILKNNDFKAGNKKDWLQKGIAYFDQKDQDLRAIADALDTFILMINPPQHTKIRRFVMNAWDNRNVEYIIQRNVNKLLAQLEGQLSFDFVEDFSSHLPAMTISDIMGIPFSDYLSLRDAGRTLIAAVNPYLTLRELVEMNDAAKVFISYFQEHIEEKGKHPGDDLISKLIRQNLLIKEPLNQRQLISICIFLFIAGEETTISFLSSAVRNLALYKSQLELLKKHPEMIDMAMEELLRYDGPVHLLGRIVSRDMDYLGQPMKKGDIVTLCLASANRDELQFKEPDRLMIDRNPNRHIAFGSGIHFCLGDWLAKIQANIALQSFISRFPNYTIDQTSVKWTKNLSIRSLDSMTIYI